MTRQIGDTLIFENKEIYLNEELLEQYFRENPDEKPEVDVSCSALWRGYVATFEIKNNELLVKEIDWLSNIELEFTSKLDEVFSNGNKFTWYSGLIRIDDFRGEFDDEPKEGFFEFLEIRNGDLTRKRSMNFQELQKFKEEQYQYFLLSEEIQLVYQFWRMNNKDMAESKINEIIRENILYYTKEVYVD